MTLLTTLPHLLDMPGANFRIPLKKMHPSEAAAALWEPSFPPSQTMPGFGAREIQNLTVQRILPPSLLSPDPSPNAPRKAQVKGVRVKAASQEATCQA